MIESTSEGIEVCTDYGCRWMMESLDAAYAYLDSGDGGADATPD